MDGAAVYASAVESLRGEYGLAMKVPRQRDVFFVDSFFGAQMRPDTGQTIVGDPAGAEPEAILKHELLHYEQMCRALGEFPDEIGTALETAYDGFRRIGEALGEEVQRELFPEGVPVHRAVSHPYMAAVQAAMYDGSLKAVYEDAEPVKPPKSTLSVHLGEELSASERRRCEALLEPVHERREHGNAVLDRNACEVEPYFLNVVELATERYDTVRAEHLFETLYNEPFFQGRTVAEQVSESHDHVTLDGIEQAIGRYRERRTEQEELSDREVAGRVIDDSLDRYTDVPPQP